MSPPYVRTSGRKHSVSSSLVGSPSGRFQDFQDRLFQQRASDNVSSSSLVQGDNPALADDLATVPVSVSDFVKKPKDLKPAQTSQEFNASGSAAVARPPKQKLSKAEARELQEMQRAEKAARIAAGGPAKLQGKPLKTTLPKVGSPPRQGSEVNLVSASGAVLPPALRPLKKQYKKDPIPNPKDGKVVGLFSHLPQFDAEHNLAKEKSSRGVIHPAIISLGVQYSYNIISGGNARCLALLLALKKVIADYITPSGNVLQRHLTQHIGRQVDYLTNTRPLAESMRTAIRFIKNEIAELSPSLPDQDVNSSILIILGKTKAC